MHTQFRLQRLEERQHMEDLCVHERITEWTLNKQDERAWTAFIWLNCLNSYEHSSDLLGSQKVKISCLSENLLDFQGLKLMI